MGAGLNTAPLISVASYQMPDDETSQAPKHPEPVYLELVAVLVNNVRILVVYQILWQLYVLQMYSLVLILKTLLWVLKCRGKVAFLDESVF